MHINIVKGITAYYNENDSFCCSWLSNLMDDGLITPGKIDDRSIVDVKPEDFKKYTRQHFFAGVAGWDVALNLAGWGNRPAMSGSCPCQPFSQAGKRKGFDDSRHLWPDFFRLIKLARPLVVFGEQVASALAWLDLVQGDLEGEDYTVGSCIVGAHSVRAPHIRQRIYWVAESMRRGTQYVAGQSMGTQTASHKRNGNLSGQRLRSGIESPVDEWVGESSEGGRRPGRSSQTISRQGTCGTTERPMSNNGNMANASIARRPGAREHECGLSPLSARSSEHGGMVLPTIEQARIPGRAWKQGGPVIATSFWNDCEYIPCIDGKSRPVKPGIFPLASGIPNRVGTLRGAGNAIVPQVAAAFIQAYLEVKETP